MGMGVSFICKDCNHEESFFTGKGMEDFSLETFFNGENKRDYNRILKMIENLKSSKEKYDIEYSREVHLCDNCKYIENKKSVSLVTKYWKYNYLYNCPKCKDKLRSIDVNIELVRGNIQCPKCESTNLYVPDFGILWD